MTSEEFNKYINETKKYGRIEVRTEALTLLSARINFGILEQLTLQNELAKKKISKGTTQGDKK